MNLFRWLLIIMLLAQASAQSPRVGRFNEQDLAPAFSSPEEHMAPNGDRVSHYPPYYHPEDGGRR